METTKKEFEYRIEKVFEDEDAAIEEWEKIHRLGFKGFTIRKSTSALGE